MDQEFVAMPKEKMIKLLHELMKNSKRSDRDLAKILKASQPTITRTRKKLEKTGYIRGYTALPDLTKLGYEIAAFTFMNVAQSDIKARIDEIEENPKILFASTGTGSHGFNCTIVSLHKDFTDFDQFISDIRSRWATNITDIDSFLVPLRGMTLKNFSFKQIGETQ